MKKVYIIRHCEAEGQLSEAHLTDKGFKQAIEISNFFAEINIDRIISSPYKRAIQSIQPLATRLNLEIEINRKLTERVLSTESLSDWLDKLKATFEDFELKFEGGESSQEAMNRIVNIVEDVFNSESENTLIVTHGNLMSLLLNFYNKNFGFEDWQNLSYPDIYLLKNVDNKVIYERLWK
ncbi:histidine phosphatase family protein [Niallia circulans]|uniref:histidine phosphatase family protein n=1 Tax=Niallia circulans TaxID=1397 RepID=UPI000BA51E1C|nr:histidine phosphatase family protein [Niallia circulans]PAD89177.1 histidine phosphatase family protein [Niallia circulans]